MRTILVCTLFAFIGCSEPKSPEVIKAEMSEHINSNIIEFEYQGHEYLYFQYMNKAGICPKVNCKYCEEK